MRRLFLSALRGLFRSRTCLEAGNVAPRQQVAVLRQRLGRQSLLRAGKYGEIASAAVRIESRTNLLFSFEKMALRDAVASAAGARAFAQGLFVFCHGDGDGRSLFEAWCEVVASLPRRQTRVLTWPIVTVFGFLAAPREHVFLKPTVTKIAAAEYGFDFRYESRPNWNTYANLLDFAATVRRDLRDMRPCDMIDVQCFRRLSSTSGLEQRLAGSPSGSGNETLAAWPTPRSASGPRQERRPA